MEKIEEVHLGRSRGASEWKGCRGKRKSRVSRVKKKSLSIEVEGLLKQLSIGGVDFCRCKKSEKATSFSRREKKNLPAKQKQKSHRCTVHARPRLLQDHRELSHTLRANTQEGAEKKFKGDGKKNPAETISFAKGVSASGSAGS